MLKSLPRFVKEPSGSPKKRGCLFLQEAPKALKSHPALFQRRTARDGKPLPALFLPKFRLYMVGLQNLRRQLLYGTEIPDGVLLALSVLHLNVDMLRVFLQNIPLLIILQDLQMLLKLAKKCFLTHTSCPPLKIC